MCIFMCQIVFNKRCLAVTASNLCSNELALHSRRFSVSVFNRWYCFVGSLKMSQTLEKSASSPQEVLSQPSVTAPVPQEVDVPDGSNLLMSAVEKCKEVSGRGLILSSPCLRAPPSFPLDNCSERLASAKQSTSFTFSPQSKPLKVKKIERHRHLNAQEHRTYYYSIMDKKGEGLVLRRGTPVRLSLLLNRPYGLDDVLFVEFILQDTERTQFADGSYVRVMVVNGLKFDTNIPEFTWAAICDLISDDGFTIHIQVRPPDKAPIGHWGMRCLTTSEKYAIATVIRKEFYIIANPWGKDFIGAPDPSDNKRNDYVLADAGVFYAGFDENPTAVPWRFGQFDQGVLNVALNFLKGCTPLYRSHLFKVVHHLSYIMNDRNGIIVEKKKSAKPRSGSKSVLLQYAKSKQKSVAGSRQIYVASCVFITICRALGIPARLVTFYSVLPENDGGLVVDRYYHTLGLLLQNVNPSNMWSYKVLPEVMVHRPDLPQPFKASGWQCVSHHGPCSVGAIRAGPLYRWKPFCTDFVYRMVKASYIYLKVDDIAKPLKVVPPRSMKTCTVVLTKAAGSWMAENVVTSYVENKQSKGAANLKPSSKVVDATQYAIPIPANYDGGKQKNHTSKCRMAASGAPTLAERVPKPCYTDIPMIDAVIDNGYSMSGFYYDDNVDVTAYVEASCSWWGEPITAAVFVKSNLKEESSAFISMEISAVSVTGELFDSLKAVQKSIKLKPGVEVRFPCQVSFGEYSELSQPGDCIRFNANVHIEEEDYDEYFEKYIGFLPLKVILKVPRNPATEQGEVFLQNVSEVIMKNCKLTVGEVDSPKRLTIFSGLKLHPGSAVQGKFNFSPKIESGVYFIEACAASGQKTSSAYAAVPFGTQMNPNARSKSFSAM